VNIYTKEERRNMKWGKMHNEEFCNLYASEDIINIIKSRNMRRER
jgi:hypothetical protein